MHIATWIQSAWHWLSGLSPGIEEYDAWKEIFWPISILFAVSAVVRQYMRLKMRDEAAARALLEVLFDVGQSATPKRGIRSWLAKLHALIRRRPPAQACIRAEMAKLSWKAWWRRKSDPIDILATVRARIEQEICDGTLGQGLKEGILWSAESVKIFCATGIRRVIPVADVGTLADDEFKAHVNRYFEALLRADKTAEPEFISEIFVENGFVAPLLLLAGLLAYLKSNWTNIIGRYNSDTTTSTDPLIGHYRATGLRKLQAFLYDTWLIWGPSIPVCGGACERWGGTKASTAAFQYGYGDENSSILLVGPSACLDAYKSNFDRQPAFHARVTGRLKYAGRIVRDETGRQTVDMKDPSSYPATITNAIRAEPQRLVLDIRPREGATRADAIDGTASARDKAGAYYSAYLWVMFVILDKANQPIHLVERGAGNEVWRSLLPFFEHGNIADGDTYALLKRQLARKSIATLDSLVNELKLQKSGLRFAYVCGFDDSGCNVADRSGGRVATGLRYQAWDEKSSLKGEMIAAMESAIHLKNKGGTPMIDFDWHMESENIFSACRLPEIIASFYEDVRKKG